MRLDQDLKCKTIIINMIKFITLLLDKAVNYNYVRKDIIFDLIFEGMNYVFLEGHVVSQIKRFTYIIAYKDRSHHMNQF